MQKRNWSILVAIALLALIWVVFGQTRSFSFVNFDDPSYVIENSAVRAGLSLSTVHWAFTHVHGGNWHPLTSISHMLDCQLFGLNPGEQHLVNLLWHAIASVLLFLLCQALTGSLWRSAFVAAIFAVHPLRVESVAWISERKDVLSAVFFMATLLAYVWYARRPTLFRYVTMSILFALGLLAKPMLVTVPLVMLLLDYWPLRRIAEASTLLRLVAEKIPLFLLAAASCVAALWAQKQSLGSTEVFRFSWRVENALVSAVIYLGQIFWPHDLAAFYPHPEDRLSILEVIGAAVVLISITVAAVALRKRRPELFTGWFWYLIMLAPVLGLVQVGLQGHADRYTYLPGIGISVAVVWIVVDFVKGWRYPRPLFAISAGVHRCVARVFRA